MANFSVEWWSVNEADTCSKCASFSKFPDSVNWSINFLLDAKAFFFFLRARYTEEQHIFDWYAVESTIKHFRIWSNFLSHFLKNGNTNKCSFSCHQLSIVNVNDEPMKLSGCIEQVCAVEVYCDTSCRCLCWGSLFTQRTLSWYHIQLVKECLEAIWKFL